MLVPQNCQLNSIADVMGVSEVLLCLYVIIRTYNGKVEELKIQQCFYFALLLL